jgi:hypothetical protein
LKLLISTFLDFVFFFSNESTVDIIFRVVINGETSITYQGENDEYAQIIYVILKAISCFASLQKYFVWSESIATRESVLVL